MCTLHFTDQLSVLSVFLHELGMWKWNKNSPRSFWGKTFQLELTYNSNVFYININMLRNRLAGSYNNAFHEEVLATIPAPPDTLTWIVYKAHHKYF